MRRVSRVQDKWSPRTEETPRCPTQQGTSATGLIAAGCDDQRLESRYLPRVRRRRRLASCLLFKIRAHESRYAQPLFGQLFPAVTARRFPTGAEGGLKSMPRTLQGKFPLPEDKTFKKFPVPTLRLVAADCSANSVPSHVYFLPILLALPSPSGRRKVSWRGRG